MSQSTASIIAAVIAGLVGILVGLIAASIQYRMKSDELFYKALDFLGGGSQVRNLGIAAIELSWNKRRFRTTSTALLIGSALYLLLASEQGEAPHEVYNLRRIMNHLLHPDTYKEVSTQHKVYNLRRIMNHLLHPDTYHLLHPDTYKEVSIQHKVYNLHRIMNHLLHPDTYEEVSIQAEYKQLQAAVQKAREVAEKRKPGTGTTSGVSRGLTLPKEELQEWEKVLARMLPDDKAEASPATEEAAKEKLTR